MKLSRRELFAAGVISVATGLPAAPASGRGSQSTAIPSRGRPTPHPPNLPVRDYLAREARRITDNALSDLAAPAEFKRRIARRRQQYMEMMGLADLPAASKREPVPYRITGTVDRASYRIEKLHYESVPNLHVTANLYVPNAATPDTPRPAVLYVCGHAANQKVHYQGHPRRFAELGFPTLIVETVQLGEVGGYHHG